MLLKYAIQNKYYVFVIAYFFVSAFLKNFGIIDITIPCAFKTLFEINCWGCGLTRATIDLLNFKFHSAWNHNPLVFLAIPLMGLLIHFDYKKFKEQQCYIIKK